MKPASHLFFPKNVSDLSIFPGEVLYDSHDAEDIHDFLNTYWGVVKVKWADTDSHLSFSRLSIGGVTCFGVTSNARAEMVHSSTLQRQSVSFLIPVQSGVDITVGEEHFSLPTRSTLMFHGQEKFALTWEANTQYLVIDVPYDLLFRLGSEVYKDRCITEQDFNCDVLLSRRRLAQLHFMLNQALFVQQRPFAQPFQAEWIRQTERNFTLLALENLLSPHSQLSDDHDNNNDRPHSFEMLEQLEAYMQDHLESPLTLNDLIAKADCSRSQLFKLCQQRVGLSPIAWLRKLRLEAARDYLMGNPELSVTELAYRFGFGHPGRFARYYQRQFGELPRET